MKRIENFEIESTQGTFRLADQLGHPVVLYFYPRDNTPGCTTEGQQFRDLYPKFLKAGAVVAGVSRDSLKSHASFSEKMGFPFPLLADPDEKLCAQFDVIRMKNMIGRRAPECGRKRCEQMREAISDPRCVTGGISGRPDHVQRLRGRAGRRGLPRPLCTP